MRPEGQSELSGTFLAHLTAVLAASAAVDIYSEPGFYARLDALGEYFYANFAQLIERSGVPLRLQHLGARFGLYFGVPGPVRRYRDAAQQNREMFTTFVAGCLARGAYWHTAAHHGFSAAHDRAALDVALTAIEGALDDVRRQHCYSKV
jgi:glutamate-1-semialdehyde 2,1-aminomutase